MIILKKKEDSKILFKKINENKIDILVGTQMISKGFNFPKLNCIVVIDTDFSGRGYDLRTTEKNIQLYHQLSGRAGRFSAQSLIIYQTLTPYDSTLNQLIKNNSEELLNNELILREKNKLPPFKRLIAIIISSKNRSFSLQGAREIKVKLNQINGDFNYNGVIQGGFITIFTYYGFQSISRLPEETKDSKNNIPKAIIASLTVSIVMYILTSIGVNSILGTENVKKTVSALADSYKKVLGNTSYNVVNVIGLFSIFNTVMLTILFTSRLLYGM